MTAKPHGWQDFHCTLCGGRMQRTGPGSAKHQASEQHQRAVREWDARHATKKESPAPVVKPERAAGI